MSNHITIGNRRIGSGQRTYIIAEMSANHGQSFEKALALVEAASSAGADAIKLQTYTADTLTLDCNNDHFQIKGTIWNGQSLHQLYSEACTPWEWQPKLKMAAENLGLHCFSSPFDATAVEFLETMNSPAYKIASFELVDLELIRQVARTGKPVLISTGMASLGEIAEAVSAFRGAGGRELALFKCTSAYPSPPEEMNLRTIPHLADAFDVPVGLSDHTLGIAVPTAAVAVGACMVEKHFTLSRADGGPDAPFSLEPAELKEMVSAIRTAEKALGGVDYTVSRKEEASRVFRRSLFATHDIPAGGELTSENVRSVRPGCGLPPKYLSAVLGRHARSDIPRGTPLSWDLLAS